MYLRVSVCALFAVLAPATCGALLAQHSPAVSGFVTSVASSGDAEINGIEIQCRGKSSADCPALHVDQCAEAYGRFNLQRDTVQTTRIAVLPEGMSQNVSGSAMLEAVTTPELLRADGYMLRLTSATQRTFDASLTPGSAFAPGQWIEYSGTREPDGTIALSHLLVHASQLSAGEENMRAKADFDPAAVKPEDRQSRLGKFLVGTNYHDVPAVHDPAQQARIDAIGKRLLAIVDRELTRNDPHRIDFLLQLVDAKWPDAVTLPSGIILVPADTVAKLPDDELAAVLADNIATALESQTYRHRLLSTPAGVAIPTAAALFTPLGVGGAVAPLTRRAVRNRENEQSGLVSLTLLAAAGYNIDSAPLAWWHLATHRADFMQVPPPRRTAYLYDVLSAVWAPRLFCA